jgi:phage tail sheath protein FI
MAQQKQGSAGTTTREIDQSIVSPQAPSGVPAGVVGTSVKGPAFVPVTVGDTTEFYARFGKTDGKKFGPLAVSEWLRNSTAATFVRVLGVGDGKKRSVDGTNAGVVNSAGFVVGEKQPLASADGALSSNPYANSGGPAGRTYFLGCFMSESAGSTVFSAAKVQNSVASVTVVRGVLFAASGVIPRLSASNGGVNAPPASSYVAVNATTSGSILGAVTLTRNSESTQEFVMLLNGHKGTDTRYPNVLTASFDVTSPNYFVNVLNTDPYKITEAGHYLYTHWDVHPALATVTGSGIVSVESGSGAPTAVAVGKETCAFLTTGSNDRNVGSTASPNYENFEDRFSHAKSPWFISQRFGAGEKNLFRLHALDAGAASAGLYKVSIENITPSSDPNDKFPNFDVIIRSWDDRDGELQPLEPWRSVNLNPSSDRYIARVIGDMHAFYDFDRTESSQKLVVEGNYPNASAYVRVEVASDVENEYIDPESFPMGTRGVYHLVTSGSAPLTTATSADLASSTVIKSAVTPPLPFRSDITAGTGAKKVINPLLYWGVQFEHATSTSTPNASTLKNETVDAFAKYFPDFMANYVNFVVGDNEGAAETASLGVVDADLFCHNKFTLENIKVVTGSNGLADPSKWDQAVYVRDGNITADDSAKTRRVKIDDFTSSNKRFLKFTTLMQGGFDGVNSFDRDEAEITNAAVNADAENTERGLNNGPAVKAYMKALDIMKNVVSTDVKLLAVPGIRNEIVTNAAIDAVEDRFDAMYLMDIEQYDVSNVRVTSNSQIPSVDYTVQAFQARGLDTSFAAAYFPDVVMQDPNTKTNVVVPPSVAVLGAFALNDSVGHPWFAPAGFSRGALTTTLEPRVRLSKSNMDTLANASINPLVAFPGNATSGLNPQGGVVVWGQKTLQVAASALDRVNVRRLLIELRRQVRDATLNVIFEPNRDATLAAISAAVTPRFRRVQALSGLDRFKIIFDASTTTQADVLNNTIRGKIIVQPTKTIEQVFLDFVVTNPGTL